MAEIEGQIAELDEEAGYASPRFGKAKSKKTTKRYGFGLAAGSGSGSRFGGSSGYGSSTGGRFGA